MTESTRRETASANREIASPREERKYIGGRVIKTRQRDGKCKQRDVKSERIEEVGGRVITLHRFSTSFQRLIYCQTNQTSPTPHAQSVGFCTRQTMACG